MTSKSLRSTMSSYHSVSLIPLLRPRSFIEYCIRCSYLGLLKWFLEQELGNVQMDEDGDFSMPFNFNSKPLSVAKSLLIALESNDENIYEYLFTKYGIDLIEEEGLELVSYSFGKAGAPLWFQEYYPDFLPGIVPKKRGEIGKNFRSFIDGALYNGHLNVLKDYSDRLWFGFNELSKAVRLGKSECVEFVLQSQETFETSTAEHLIAFGQIGDVVAMRWMVDHGCPWIENAGNFGARNGHVEFLRYLKHERPQLIFSMAMMLEAIEGRNVKAIEFLLEQGVTIGNSSDCLVKAGITADLDLVDFILSKCDGNQVIRLSPQQFCEVILSGSVEVVERLLPFVDSSRVSDREVVEFFLYASRCWNPDMLDFVISKFSRPSDTDFPDVKTLSMLKKLHSLGIPIIKYSIRIIRDFQLDGVNFLDSIPVHLSDEALSGCLNDCMAFNNPALIRALVERGMKFNSSSFATAARSSVKMLKLCLALGLEIPFDPIRILIDAQSYRALKYIVKSLLATPSHSDFTYAATKFAAVAVDVHVHHLPSALKIVKFLSEYLSTSKSTSTLQHQKHDLNSELPLGRL